MNPHRPQYIGQVVYLATGGGHNVDHCVACSLVPKMCERCAFTVEREMNIRSPI